MMMDQKWTSWYKDYEISFELLTSRDGSRRIYKIEIQPHEQAVLPHKLYVGTFDDIEGAVSDFIDGLALEQELFQAQVSS